jgi:hypothetical protein
MPAAKTKPRTPPLESAPDANVVTVAAPANDNPDDIKAMTALTYAQSFTIASASDSAKGQEACQRLNAQIKALDDKRKELTKPLDALKAKWMAFFGGPIEKLKTAKAILDQKVIAYDAAQEEIRKAEQRRLDKIAEDERKRLQAIADEAERKARETADQKRREADEAAAAGRQAEAEKLLSQAAKVEEKAADKAELFQSRAASVVAPVVQAETVRVSGSSFRTVWEFEIVDVSKINAQFLMPDAVKIGKIVDSLKLDAVAVVGEGIKVTSRKTLASRRS